MRIPCPFCGARDISEFAYLGDAKVVRPDPDAAGAEANFVETFYLRDNPPGWHHELWYHAYGCRSWLNVERNIRTHEISGAKLAMESTGT